jgi:hypothetical protein
MRRMLKRIAIFGLLGVASALLLVYAGDFAVFRYRVAANRNAYGSVTVNHYTAVLQKNGKTTLTFDPPTPWTCVNSLFSHQGWLPCWYLSRHPDQRTDI